MTDQWEWFTIANTPKMVHRKVVDGYHLRKEATFLANRQKWSLAYMNSVCVCVCRLLCRQFISSIPHPSFPMAVLSPLLACWRALNLTWPLQRSKSLLHFILSCSFALSLTHLHLLLSFFLLSHFPCTLQSHQIDQTPLLFPRLTISGPTALECCSIIEWETGQSTRWDEGGGGIVGSIIGTMPAWMQPTKPNPTILFPWKKNLSSWTNCLVSVSGWMSVYTRADCMSDQSNDSFSYSIYLCINIYIYMGPSMNAQTREWMRVREWTLMLTWNQLGTMECAMSDRREVEKAIDLVPVVVCFTDHWSQHTHTHAWNMTHWQ